MHQVGALLFDRFRGAYLGSPQWSVPFDLADPIETPRDIPPYAARSSLRSCLGCMFQCLSEGVEDRAEAEAAVAALVRVAREMEEEDGQPLDMPWGDFKKLPEDVNGVHWGASSQPLPPSPSLRQALSLPSLLL